MRATIDRKKVLLILDWCITRFGISRFHDDYPELRVYKSRGSSGYENKKSGLCGTYGSGVITIYLGSNHSVRELCNTVIHEYKHYLLNHDEYEKIEKKLEKSGISSEELYTKHPHEKSAVRMENKYGDICYAELRNQLYKKTKKP
jgi:hypothetical protein